MSFKYNLNCINSEDVLYTYIMVSTEHMALVQRIRRIYPQNTHKIAFTRSHLQTEWTFYNK